VTAKLPSKLNSPLFKDEVYAKRQHFGSDAYRDGMFWKAFFVTLLKTPLLKTPLLKTPLLKTPLLKTPLLSPLVSHCHLNQ